MNYNETPLSKNEEEYVTYTQSYSSVPSGSQSEDTPPKYEPIETREQNQQCCLPCNNRPRNSSRFSRFSWRRLLSFLPSWMKNTNPAGPAGFEAVATSKPKPSLPIQNTNQVQMCHTHTHTPIQSGHQQINQECSEKKCSKKSSYERLISNYNFDEASTDQRSSCEPCMNSGKNSKLIQIGVAEVSSHKAKSRCCICSKRKAQKTTDNSSCQQSLLEQAWEYLQSIIFTHRSGCPRCNKKQSPCASPKPCPSPQPSCPNPKPTCPNYKPPCPKPKPPCPKPCPNSPPCVKRRTSNDSSSCKESLLDLAKAYLKKITSEHKSGCPRCKQQAQCCYPKEPSCLRYMLEQAWAYIKKSCEQKTCQQQGALSCCTHPSTRPPACSNPGILKYPSSKSACCCSNSVPDCPDKKLCQAISCPKPEKSVTCPKICEQPPVPCKSEVEGTHEHKSCYTPCCIHNSQGIQPSYTSGSHHKSCCLSQLSVKAQKQTLPKKPCDDSTLQSYEEPPFNLTFTKNSSANMLGREIMGFHSSTQCSAPCSKDTKDTKGGKRPGSPGKGSPMRGLSLTMEPKDHKFCTRPKDCKHSKQSLENLQKGQPDSGCEKVCSGPCNVPKTTYEQGAQTPELECPGGCEKCPSEVAAAPMYEEQRMVDAEYEAFLDEQFGQMVTKQLLDKETICESGCSCLTCIASIQTTHKDKTANRKDPHNYRYYY